MEKPRQDIAVLGGPTEDKKGTHVLRLRDQTVSAGILRPLVEGEAIHGEVVALRAHEGAPPFIRDVEVLYSPERGGPAQVATDAYRKNWDAVFGTPEGAPN